MAIPITQQTVMPDATQATAPEELHPVAAAFGGDIGAALEKSGSEVADRIQALSIHMARLNYYRGEAQKVDLANNYKQGLHDQIHGDPSNPNATVTYTPDANTPGLKLTQGADQASLTSPVSVENPIDRPLGVLNWKGNMANGSLDYLDQWHQQAQAQVAQQAKGLGLRNLGSLQRDIQDAWTSQRDIVADNEMKEINKAQVATYFKGMQLDAENAVTAQNPVGLKNILNSISAKNDLLQGSQYGEGDSPEKQINSDLTLNKMHTQAINNYMTANLKMNGGDPTQAQATLDKLNTDGTINDTVHDQASLHLEQLSKSIIEGNQRAAKVQDINTTLNYVGQVINGKLDLTNPNVVNEIRANSPTAGAAIDNYTLNKSVSVKPDDEAIANSVDELYKTGSKEQIAKFNVGLMQKFPNGIPQDVVNTMIADGIDRASRSADLEKEQQVPDAVQTRINGGMNALQRWNKSQPTQDSQSYVDYMNNIHNKMAPMEAYNDAVRNSLIRKNPEVATIDPEKMPNQIASASHGLTNVTPNQSQAEANYHVKDGMIQPKGAQVQTKFSEGMKAYNSKTKETAIFTGGKWQIIKQ